MVVTSVWRTLTELSGFVCHNAVSGPICLIRLYCHCLTSTIYIYVLCIKRQTFYPLRHNEEVKLKTER